MKTSLTMIIKQTLILPLIILPVATHGQATDSDSIHGKDLEEITVTADAQFTSATKTVYFPDANQKSTASDGISLLSRMNIPQLRVNPIAGTVTTADNQGVSLFVNYSPATDADVDGLNPKDVKRIEYLDFPVDPRFQRAPHVVNFITRSHTYGGYTKISAKQRFLVGSGEASAYSKFACRKMEYDIVAGGDYDRNSHIGSASDETFRLPAGTVSRKTDTEAGRHRQRGLYTALRAAWNNSENLTWRNMVSYSRENIPVSNTSGNVAFSALYPSEAYLSESHSSNNALGWDSELYAAWGKGWSVNGTFHAEYLKNSSGMNYTSGPYVIDNDADEHSWWLRGDVQINRTLSDQITLFSGISSGGGRTKINYTGSSDATNRFRQTFTGLTVGLSISFRKVSGSIDGGYALESNYINGKAMYDSYPFTHINVRYAPDQKHSIGLWFQYATFSPDATMKNPNVIQQSELMYIFGNPDLRCSRNTSANVSYTWLPDNRWQMSAYATMFRVAHRQIAVYTPDAPGGLMLKKYQNDGNYNHGQLGAAITGKFLDGRLSFSVAPRLLLYKTTGSNSISHYPFTASVSAGYYLGNFFFNAYYDSAWSYVDGDNAYLLKMPMSCSISAGWASRGWNIELSLVNPFQSGWKISEGTLNTRWYDSSVTQFGPAYHRRISVTVAYTFTYGRKVNHAEELSGEKSISSSILR